MSLQGLQQLTLHSYYFWGLNYNKILHRHTKLVKHIHKNADKVQGNNPSPKMLTIFSPNYSSKQVPKLNHC